MNKVSITLATLILLLSGCIKMDVSMKINSDGSGTNTILFAINQKELKEAAEQSGMVFNESGLSDDIQINEAKKNFEEQGYDVDDYNEGDLIGIKATKNFKDLSELVIDGKDNIFDNITLIKDEEKGKYVFEVNFSDLSHNTEFLGEPVFIPENGIDVATSLSNSESISLENVEIETKKSNIDLNNIKINDENETKEANIELLDANVSENIDDLMADVFEIHFKVEFPTKPIEHNATEMDGNILIWDIVKMEEGETLNAEFEIESFESGEKVSSDSNDDTNDGDRNNIIFWFLMTLAVTLILIVLYGIRLIRKV